MAPTRKKSKLQDLSTDGDVFTAGRFLGVDDVVYSFKVANGKPRISSMPYTFDIAEGNVTDHTPWSRIGYNGATVADAEVDIWSKGGAYVFPLVADGWDVVSSSAGDEDDGTSIFSGTSSGGTTTSLIDATKDFTAGTPVEVGDCVILDKSGTTPEWGYVTAVAATTLTIGGGFSEGGTGFGTAGRAYTVIDKNTAGDTGAQAVKIEYLDGDYAEKSEIVVLDGDAPVNTINTDMFRVNSFRVIAGAKAVGNLSLRLEGGAATVYSYITAGFTRARNSAYTVPANKTLYVTSWTAGYGYRSNSTHFARIYTKANMEPSTGLNTRDIFYPFTEILLSNNSINKEFEIPTKLPAKTDIKVSVLSTFIGVATSALRGWLE